MPQVALTTELLRASRERLSRGPEAEAAARERFHAYVVGISSVQGRLSTPFRAPCAPPPLAHPSPFASHSPAATSVSSALTRLLFDNLQTVVYNAYLYNVVYIAIFCKVFSRNISL